MFIPILPKPVRKALDLAGINLYDGKNVIYIRDGELHQGMVCGNDTVLGWGTPLDKLAEASRLKLICEAANSLNVTPSRVEERLTRGKTVLYNGSKERE